MSGYLSVRSVVQAVCAVTGISASEIVGVRRSVDIVRPRHLAMYLTGIYCPHMSLPQVGRAFGGRDHTTVLHARKKIADEVTYLGEGSDLTEIKTILDSSLSVLKRISTDDIPDADPMAIAERAMTDHEVTRITYDEIRVMGSFIINVVTQNKLIHEVDDSDLDYVDETISQAVLRVIKARQAMEAARFSTGEAATAQVLSASIEALAAVYARRVGPVPAVKPVFKTSSNAPRKEANLG